MVQVAIVSAGYGVVAEDRLIALYDVTFSTEAAEAVLFASKVGRRRHGSRMTV